MCLVWGSPVVRMTQFCGQYGAVLCLLWGSSVVRMGQFCG